MLSEQNQHFMTTPHCSAMQGSYRFVLSNLQAAQLQS